MPLPLRAGVAALSGFIFRRFIRRPSAGTRHGARLATLALGGLASAATLGAQGLALSGFSPAGAAPGEPIVVTGSGFSSEPADHLAFVLGGWGRGAFLEPASSSPGTMRILLGPSASRFDGPVCLWRGRRHFLPGALVAGESGVWLVQQAELFVPSEAAATVKPFLVEEPTPQTHGAVIDRGDVVLDVEPNSAPGGPTTKIDLMVMVDGGGSCGPGIKPGGDAPLAGGAALEARAFHLRLENVDPLGPADGKALAHDLALVLRSTFGAMGLAARADGSALHVSWSRLARIENGLGVLRFGR